MTTAHDEALALGDQLRAGEQISLRAPDPDAMGKIRNIVKTANKWGGDGRKPKFRKIRTVLLAKHPEVIAKAFGGNADVAAAWIKNNWYRMMKGTEPPPTRGKGSLAASLTEEYVEVDREFFDGADELFCAATAEERDGLVWTTALRTGTWTVNPTGGRGPLKIDRNFMEDVLQAWREGVWEHVTVPTYHTDADVLANTGFVRDLQIISDPKRKEHFLLRAGIEFTEPDVKTRILRGSIAGVSVNVKYNITHQESGKTYPKVLTHLALTNIPFINGLDAFKRRFAASQEAVPDEVRASFIYEDESAPDMSVMAEVAFTNGDIWDETEDYQYVRQKLSALVMKGYYLDPEGDLVDPSGMDTNGEKEDVSALTPAYVALMGMTPDRALVSAMAQSGAMNSDYSDVREKNGNLQGWVFGYEVDTEGNLVIDPIDEWTKVEKAWIELSREFQIFESENNDLEAENSVSEKREKLATWGVLLPSAKSPATGSSIRVISESLKGGANMADETTTTEEVTLTRADLDRIAEERAEAILSVYRQEQEERDRTREEELSATRRQLHEMSVREKLDQLKNKGHAPALLVKAKELMLADERQTEVLSLTRDEQEIKLSATQIIEELLEAVPETALDLDQVNANTTGEPPAQDTDKTRADRLYDQLYGEGAEAVTLSD